MENFKNLPSDIIFDILSRLPAESLLECKLVCKPWKYLVQHPSLSRIHLDYAGKSSFIFLSRRLGFNELFYSEYDENCHEAPFHGYKQMNLKPPSEEYSLIGSCNGLVCFRGWDMHETWVILNCGPYICNPITRECIMLPTSKGEKDWWVGFGYVISTDEYKVVRISESAGSESKVGIVQVYTLGSGDGWRNVGTIDINMRRMSQYAGAFANGAIHWVSKDVSVVLAFNLADENFSRLPPPPPPPYLSPDDDDPCFNIVLGVLGDSVSATYSHKGDDCDVWLLKKSRDNNDFSWNKEFTYFNSYASPPFEFTKSGRLLCCGHNRIYRHHPKASSAEMDVSFGKPVCEAIPHKNTLVSLKVLGEKDTKTMMNLVKKQVRMSRQKPVIN